MQDLQKLIEEERRKNNELKVRLEGNKDFPSQEATRETGTEPTLEFIFKLKLEILVSNYRLIGLMEAYSSASQELERKEPIVAKLDEMVKEYRMEAEHIKVNLIGRLMKGYRDSW